MAPSDPFPDLEGSLGRWCELVFLFHGETV